MATAHTRHTWQRTYGRRVPPAYRCQRCKAVVPASLVEQADRMGESRVLPLEIVLDLLHEQSREVAV